MPKLPRRDFLIGSAAAAAGTAMTAAGALPANESRGPVVCISSGNGLGATKRAYEMIMQGSDPVDAVVAGVGLVEADERDTSVGYGGLPNELGVVELDAAVMHGPTHSAGAVASIQNIKHPAQVALKVMRRTDHVLLVGRGALRFARAHGFQEENLLTERARKIWLKWKETLSDKDDWLAPEKMAPDVAAFFEENSVIAGSDGRRRFVRPTGTIHCSAINAAGSISCTTTTSGLAFKIPGRVGDSPIIGAGLYCDNEVGSAGSTGRGEANLQNMCSFAAVELMRQGAGPEEAGMEVLKRVAKTTPDRLRNDKGEPAFGLKFYVLAKDGRHAGLSMRGPCNYAVTDARGTRRERGASLYSA